MNPPPAPLSNMESSENKSPGVGGYSTAVPLDLSHEVASRADDLLREFAEDSGLETALIVDRSGSLVAGISAEAEVTIEVISALVAGASGAMRALVAQLGETGAIESLHLGGDRMIYLREIVNRFILVGVADSTRPAGVVRSTAHRIEGALADLLREIRPAEVPDSVADGNGSRPLRDLVPRRSPESPAVPMGQSPIRHVDADGFATAGEEGEFEVVPIFDSEKGSADSSDAAGIEVPSVEPREILEPLEYGEPEIVIEPSTPFQGGFTKIPTSLHSPLEVNSDWPEEPAQALLLPPESSIFELEDDFDDDGAVFELLEEDDGAGRGGGSEGGAGFVDLPVFRDGDSARAVGEGEGEEEESEGLEDFEEFDRAGDHEGVSLTGYPWGSFFEGDDEEVPVAGEGAGEGGDGKDFTGEIEVMIAEEEDESEVRRSGPFYF